MKISRNISKISVISMTLLITISAILVALPAVTAQEQTRNTYPFLGVVPNPVGKDQPVLFHVGIFQQLSSAKMSWHGLSITIEKPDGTTDTISDINTDATGGTGKTYTPNQVGTYYCTAHFPQQVVEEGVNEAPGIPIGTVMLASNSEVLELVVQDEPIPYYPDNPLPSEYWTRPIDAQLRSWKAVTGNWLTATQGFPLAVPGNAEAPESAHILWTKPLYIGGVSGATGTDYAEWSFSHGDAYEGKWENRLIINGILIYTHRTNTRPLVYTAVDVRTGEELWNKVLLDNRTIAFGQNLIWGGYNHHAVYPYFWVTVGGASMWGPPTPATWYAFDPWTGEQEFTVTNVPSGTTVFDDQGWIYCVGLDYDTGEGYIWSMVDLIEPFGESSPNAGSWLPAGSFYGRRYGTWDAAAVANETTGELTEAAQRAYISEFTFDADQCPGGASVVRASELSASRQMANINEWTGKVFGLQYSTTAVNTWAISLEAGKEGTILFSETWNAPAEWAVGQIEIEFNTVSLEDGAAVIWEKENLAYHAFSTDTGKHMWGPTEGEYYTNYYGWTELVERPPFIWDGKLYSTGAGGVIYCYDLTDGKVLWTYAADDPYQEYLFANNWWQFFLFIADGKLYSAHMEHSAIEPMPRGAPFLCLNATTGDLIWRADGLFRSTRWGGRGIIGDSVMVGMDTYDNRLYAVGKGPSETTVEAPLTGMSKGTSVVIRGRVTDVSPGTKDPALQMRFSDGVPAVSDASMSDWMLYVYKQFACPADVEGVEVFLKIQDPNGDWYSATVTADGTGMFSLRWTPAVVGEYHVTAMFEGSESYYASQATTTFGIDEAPVAEDVPSAEEIADTTASKLPEIPAYLTIDLVILIIAAIGVVIGLIVYMALRKQK